jgi:membrane-associated phospholipid phosphatase
MMVRRRFARLITEVLAPANVGSAVFLLVAWHSTPTIAQALRWGLLTILFTIALPFSFILWGVRRQRFTDHHIRLREQRPLAIAVSLGSALAGLILLIILGAPRELIALVVAMATGLVIALLITLFWKMSIHVASVAGAIVILVLVFGPPFVFLAPLVALVGWARVQLGDHTPGQVAAGVLIGSAVAASVFQLLR